MSVDVSDRVRGVGPRARAVGRLALWALVALLLLRGLGAIISPPDDISPTEGEGADQRVDGPVAAFAVHFARDYFADPRGVARHGKPGTDNKHLEPGVAQAEVVGSRPVVPSESVVTVACELTTGHLRNLAIPIRQEAGEITVLGAPYLVAGSVGSAFEPERGSPVSGVDAEEIAKLVIRFIDAYASTGRPADLVYFVAPGSEVTPLGGFDLVGEPDVAQLDDGETQRTVTARVRLKDQATGVVYPLRYRLELVRRQRWFVAGVQGTSR
ncbi:MAG: conjugal transfer protein [Solirubrobacterales bacterium]|nr:conjugal transfer protein [Solirubrobacterales bacterium]